MTPSFILFGATGDLTERYLLPAFAQLIQADKLPSMPTIVGVGREPWDQEQFRRHAEQQLILHSETDDAARRRLLAGLDYHRADVTDPHQVRAAMAKVPGPVIAYLALPAGLFAPVIRAMAAVAREGTRIVIEKPFGEDLASAQALNRLLHASFSEAAIFRMDHFLGIRTVQNILELRIANRLFESVWSCEHISRVEIIWEETLGLEGRASYYDRAGALRDMVQNHLLQVLCYIGMEPPAGIDADDVRDRKVDVLRAVKSMTPEEVHRHTVRARYGAGHIADSAIAAYVEEEGIDPARRTETFVEAAFSIENRRWNGVPFVLRTGKALARDRQEIVIHFKPALHAALDRKVLFDRIGSACSSVPSGSNSISTSRGRTSCSAFMKRYLRRTSSNRRFRPTARSCSTLRKAIMLSRFVMMKPKNPGASFSRFWTRGRAGTVPCGNMRREAKAPDLYCNSPAIAIRDSFSLIKDKSSV